MFTNVFGGSFVLSLSYVLWLILAVQDRFGFWKKFSALFDNYRFGKKPSILEKSFSQYLINLKGHYQIISSLLLCHLNVACCSCLATTWNQLWIVLNSKNMPYLKNFYRTRSGKNPIKKMRYSFPNVYLTKSDTTNIFCLADFLSCKLLLGRIFLKDLTELYNIV